MNQKETPLFDALIEYGKKQIYSFHVPGHKDGVTFPERGEALFHEILKIDATEVLGLDDLYDPTDVILSAQELLIDLYKTKKSYFLVNGTTVGNLVMVLSACRPHDKVLVQRNSHKSIFNALKMARVNPVFIAPESGRSGIPVGISRETVRDALEQHPDAKALILTYPNYYGMAKKDYEEIIRYVKEKGLLVLVDEAHGAHFIMGSPVPKSTLSMGADIVVQSAHKTLPAMTMGSYLHILSQRIDFEKVEEYLERLQTSSPSYPIMASLDLARAHLASIDREKLQSILKDIDAFKLGIMEKGFDCVEEDLADQDPFKVILRADGQGFHLQEALFSAGLYPEMADRDHVLLTLPIGGRFPVKEILPVFEKVFGHFIPNRLVEGVPYDLQSQPMTTPVISYEASERLEKELIPLQQAEGRIAAKMVIPYPPGVPLLLDGERITDDHLDHMKALLDAGARFHGLNGDHSLWVYKMNKTVM